MEKSNLKVARPLGNLERLFTIRQAIGYYTNICATVRYQCKDLFMLASVGRVTELNDNTTNQLRPVVYGILTELLLKEPALSKGIKGPMTKRPLYVHIPTIDLSRQVRFAAICSDEQLEKMLEEEHKIPLDHSIETNPLWRIVFGINIEHAYEISVTFCWHHSIGDGMSAHVLHSLFYNALKKVIDNQNDLSSISPMIDVPYAPMFKPLEETVDIEPSVGLILKEVFNEFLLPTFMKTTPKHYVGDVHAMKINDFNTSLKIVSINQDEFRSIKLVSKQQKTSIHAILHTALILSAYRYLSSENDNAKMVSTDTPISLRPYGIVPITKPTLGVYVSKFHYAASTKDIDTGFWNLAKNYKYKLMKGMKTSIQYVGLLKFLSNNTAGWEEFLSKKRKVEPMGRVASLDSANVTGPAIMVNIGTYGDKLNFTVAYQEGAIEPKEKINKFIDGVKFILTTIAKEGSCFVPVCRVYQYLPYSWSNESHDLVTNRITTSITVSGEALQEPVASRKSGHIYEKRLILKYIADNGRDPITGEDIAEEDLLDIKTSPKIVKPRPPQLSSIPSMISALQNEWDSLMLETFTLKQQYQEVRQELSHALYQHDAACRVIARLIKERDAARDALAKVQAHIGASVSQEDTQESQSMDVEMLDRRIDSSIIEKMSELNAVLSKGRKKRKTPPNFTSIDSVRSYKWTSEAAPMHASSAPGITSLDISSNGHFVLTGGVDHTAIIYNSGKQRIDSVLKGHTKEITDVLWRGKADPGHPDIAFTASSDNNVKIWQPSDGGYFATSTIKAHSAGVTGIALNPTLDYVVSVSSDSTWAFHDVETGKTLSRIESNEVQNGYTAAKFHPDALLLGTGTNDSMVHIWDMKSQNIVAPFSGHSGAVTALAFSENGYYLATTSEDNLVRLWDLRKLTNFKVLTLPEDNKLNKVVWDHTGQYLAVGGTDVRVFHSKTWEELAVLADNTAEVTDLKFGELAKYLAVVGLDGSLRYYSPERGE
ncbi:5744_t:CDS:10 [Paraglomus occultum]|uniref:Pre-mRNA-processing factor 19 n=1 Tax=Paraglomus occultum TaxID=144539 RepID=A0A9N9F0S8_9GLOM|nr:5744_t:CDS:10 [Paraglomus occultum]